MSDDFLNPLIVLPMWGISLVVALLLGAATELGFRIGRFGVRTASSDQEKAVGGPIKSAILALCGLLLAFSYSISAQRYELRSQIVVHEANALGTCWLRSDFLDEPARREARKVIESILSLRLALFDLGTVPESYDQIDREIRARSMDLWRIVSNAVRNAPQPLLLQGLVQSTNEVIDLNSTRAAAIANRVPLPIFALLFLSMIVTTFMIGHWSGQAGRRMGVYWLTIIALTVSLFTLMVDLDRPRRGLIKVSHAPLLELQEEITRTPNGIGSGDD